MPLTGFYVDGPWGQIHGRSIGDASDPTAVLLHESPLSSRVYEAVMDRIGPGLRVVALDTPGYGASAPPPGPATELEEYAGALLGAADALGVGAFVAAGGHTGAALAVELARQAGPRRIPGIMLSGVPVYNDEQRAHFLATWAPEVVPDRAGSQFRWALDRYHRVWGSDTPAELLHLAVVELGRALPVYSWAYNASFRYDAGAALAALEPGCDVYLLTAEHDMFADRDQPTLDLLGRGRRTVLAGLAGQPHLRAPGRYADELAGYVSAVLAGDAGYCR